MIGIFHFKKLILIFIAIGIIILSTWSSTTTTSGSVSVHEPVCSEYYNSTLQNSQFSTFTFTSFGYSATLTSFSTFGTPNVSHNYSYVIQDFTILKQTGEHSWKSYCSFSLNMSCSLIQGKEIHISPGSYKVEAGLILDYTNFSNLVNSSSKLGFSDVVLQVGFPYVLFYFAIIDLSAIVTLSVFGYIGYRNDLKSEL